VGSPVSDPRLTWQGEEVLLAAITASFYRWLADQVSQTPTEVGDLVNVEYHSSFRVHRGNGPDDPLVVCQAEDEDDEIH
jgi:hypothetical protein